jgi:uncharacterized protein YcaQ
VARLEELDRGADPPTRTTLLSPFDNLICHRKRTLALWDFVYTIEIYVPKAKRRYGYYVLPILHHDRLVGRLDAAMDKQTGIFTVLSVHAEPDAPADAGEPIGAAIADLAKFRGARDVAYAGPAPRPWSRVLR